MSNVELIMIEDRHGCTCCDATEGRGYIIIPPNLWIEEPIIVCENCIYKAQEDYSEQL